MSIKVKEEKKQVLEEVLNDLCEAVVAMRNGKVLETNYFAVEEVSGDSNPFAQLVSGPSVQPNKDILNVQEAADMMGLRKSYVYKMVHENSIPFYKSAGGKRVYFKRDDLEKWMLGRRVPTQAELDLEALRYVANRPRI